jgi:methionine-rich copper-binding protein CopC
MKRLIGYGSVSLLLLLTIPSHVWCHAYLVKSSPARRAAISSAPARVTLWFNERLEAQFSQLTVWTQAGQRIDTNDVQVGPDDSKKLSVGLPTLPAGTYLVRYRVLSVDGHVVEADFPFTVRSRP